jgi:UDP-N-acetylglucosamine 4,6-dehydratase
MKTKNSGKRVSSSSFLEDKTVLITGGTGSFGQNLAQHLLSTRVRKIILFSRDELKQYEMRHRFGDDARLRFFIGDIRDLARLRRAFQDVDFVFHAAALKQVPSCEYNPYEAVKTNILGAQNIIEAAIDCSVSRVIALSTDKAVNPVNLYGATKLVHEKLFVDGNAYVGGRPTRFSVVRYGNVMGSRGSVIPLFIEKKRAGVIPVTDKRMTRFWISMDRVISFVLHCLFNMRGGEIFVPKIPSMRIVDLARVIAPEAKIEFTGIRPGEKLSELLIHADESRHVKEYDDFFVILPAASPFLDVMWEGGGTLPEGFVYSSDKNTEWITLEEMRSLVRPFLAAAEVVKSAG